MRRFTQSLLLAMFAMPVSVSVFAGSLSVTPIRVELSNAQRSVALTVRNDGDQPAVVQSQLVAWSQDNNEDKLELTQDLIASPPIFTIPGGGTQIVRVALRRAADPGVERSYRILVTEVPGKAQPGFTGAQFALKISLPIFVDATSSAFAQPMDWPKCDVTTFSWQKVLGGEAAHGMLVLSPRAVQRLETYTPSWPLPKVFRLVSGGKLIKGIFEGETINTPSMLCVEDYLDSLAWAESIGGLKGLRARADANAKVIWDWIERTPWVGNLAEDKATRSNTSVCIKIVDPAVANASAEVQAQFAKDFAAILEKEGAALDAGGYRDAPPGLRIWCGSTVEASDVQALLPWLDWAFAATRAKLA